MQSYYFLTIELFNFCHNLVWSHAVCRFNRFRFAGNSRFLCVYFFLIWFCLCWAKNIKFVSTINTRDNILDSYLFGAFFVRQMIFESQYAVQTSFPSLSWYTDSQVQIVFLLLLLYRLQDLRWLLLWCNANAICHLLWRFVTVYVRLNTFP
jgi:hypothetical protein